MDGFDKLAEVKLLHFNRLLRNIIQFGYLFDIYLIFYSLLVFNCRIFDLTEIVNKEHKLLIQSHIEQISFNCMCNICDK